MIWAGGRGGGTSHPGLALGKFLTQRLAGENRRFFKHPGKSECVSDLCDFLTRTAFVQSKSLTTPPVRVVICLSPCIIFYPYCVYIFISNIYQVISIIITSGIGSGIVSYQIIQ